MRVHLLFFGVLSEAFSARERWVDVPDGVTVRAVVERVQAECPDMGELWSRIAIGLNREYAGLDARVADGDEIALLPPVSGGAPAAALTREAIDREAAATHARSDEDGALVLFDGVVRNNTRGRKTLSLDYVAYEEMALRQMESLAAEAKSRFGVREATITHRLGRLEIGETSVLIVVASAHRAAAFDACRWIIDRLKKTVPIWKKEHFVDGAVWADGEPFPPELGGPA